MDAQYTSQNGEHWRAFNWQLRQIGRFSAAGRFIYRVANALLLPMSLLNLALFRILLPVIDALVVRKTRISVASAVSSPPSVANPRRADASVEPQISIVVPFYNRRASVAECLNSILDQKLPGDAPFEIIAVDNASTDGTADELAKFPVRIIHCSTPGPSATRNAGWREARAPIVAFTDSDCVVAPDWLTELTKPFSRDDVLWCSGLIDAREVDSGPTYAAQVFRILNNEVFFRGSAYFPPFGATANAAYRKTALEKAGGFDENIWMSEDADLGWRVLDLGGTAVYCNSALVRHAHRTTLRGLYNQAVGYGLAAVAVFAKHRHRFGVSNSFDWVRWRTLAWLPFDILWCLLTKKGFSRVGPLYFLVWNSGITMGCIRGSLRYRTMYL